jgi:hypothetical protein
MTLAAEPVAPSGPRNAGERRLARWLRFFALLFATGAIVFLLRPEETVADLNLPGRLFGLPPLEPGMRPIASDFWFALAIANMATIATCCWLAASDVRRRRVLVYPVVVSKLVSSGTGILLFVRWAPAFPYLAVALVDLPIAVILIAALRGARPDRA